MPTKGGTMSSLLLVLMMQLPATTSFLVSTKAGLVNYVEGTANVKAATSVPAGKVVETGAGGAVEILLNPGSYLRMGENSKVVLDSVELYQIDARILQGSMVITANGFEKESPLKVTTGTLSMEIIKDGIYLFADGRVAVVDGKIRDASNGLVYGKNYQISNDQGYRAQKVKTFTTGLELWSQKRDEAISRANQNVASSLRRSRDIPLNSLLDVWFWYPAFGSFIYLPGTHYRSPYGYRYLTAGDPQYPAHSSGGFGNSSASSGGGFSNSSTSNTSGGSSNTGGGGFGGGGGASAPAVAPPSQSSPPAGTAVGGRAKVD
jgi:FecR protein